MSQLSEAEKFFYLLEVTVQEAHHEDTHVRATNELGGFREVIILDCGGHKFPLFARLFERCVASELQDHVTN